MAAGQSPGKMTIYGLLLPVTVRLPAGDRQEIADPVITAVQGHENRPATYRCANLEIRQKSAGHRSIYVVLGRRLYFAWSSGDNQGVGKETCWAVQNAHCPPKSRHCYITDIQT